MNVVDLRDAAPERRPHERMCELVLSFPCLVLAEPVFRSREGNWCPRTFLRWARRHAYSSGQRFAAQFVLHVWNGSVRWSIGRFDVIEAMSTWDEGNRRAFLRWAERPWWP